MKFRLTLFALVLGWSSACGSTQAPATPASSRTPPCPLTATARDRLLALDYMHFDQDPPKGGWREFFTEGSPRCAREIADVIDAYDDRHKTLKPWQHGVLIWHVAQLSAVAGNAPRARAAMTKSLKPDEAPTAEFLWNPFVRANLAFVDRDRAALVRERALLAAGSHPGNHTNLRMVDHLLRCFDAPYELAMIGACAPVETRAQKIASLAIRIDRLDALPDGLAHYFQSKKLIVISDDRGAADPFVTAVVTAVADPSGQTAVIGECRSWNAALVAAPNMTVLCTSAETTAKAVAAAGGANVIVVLTDAAHAAATTAAAKPAPMTAVTIAVHGATDAPEEASAVPWPAFFMEEPPGNDAVLFVR